MSSIQDFTFGINGYFRLEISAEKIIEKIKLHPQSQEIVEKVLPPDKELVDCSDVVTGNEVVLKVESIEGAFRAACAESIYKSQIPLSAIDKFMKDNGL